MNLEQYHRFTQQLVTNLEADPRVLGLIAAGSMAAQGRHPDQWSDHDFLVVVESGQQEEFRQNLRWVPDDDHIIFSFRETEHGVKAIFDYGHLIEFAVFDPAELQMISANEYRLLIDRANLAPILTAIAEKTVANAAKASDTHYLGQFLSHLMIGAARYKRGEKLSGHRFIKDFAMVELLWLLGKYLPAENKAVLDNLDALRRFEKVFPEIGATLNDILLLNPIDCAIGMLKTADTYLRPTMPNFPANAFTVIQRYLQNIQAS
ncbi:MAG: hypothetical protein K8L91_05845 [Anaerolineae bacterium]|nr:hypothetical protein [Anaerolineae bacterium]